MLPDQVGVWLMARGRSRRSFRGDREMLFSKISNTSEKVCEILFHPLSSGMSYFGGWGFDIYG